MPNNLSSNVHTALVVDDYGVLKQLPCDREGLSAGRTKASDGGSARGGPRRRSLGQLLPDAALNKALIAGELKARNEAPVLPRRHVWPVPK